jgi:hypothetical protein
MRRNKLFFMARQGQVRHTSQKRLHDTSLETHNIALIQFHPSYSYEDFIEGIKPNLSETGQANGFSKQDGFFKKLVKKHGGNIKLTEYDLEYYHSQMPYDVKRSHYQYQKIPPAN